MRRSVRLLLLVLLLAMLAGCGDASLTSRQAQATAVAGGCWPYGVVQPPPPSPAAATATPRIQPPDAPPPAMPAALATATPAVVYPMCTPAPLTPTLTPTPTTPTTPVPAPTAQPPAAISAAHELQDAAGVVSERGLAWAHSPRTNGPVIAWVSFAWRADQETDGLVWVTSRTASGAWHDPQTVNIQPVTSNYGRVALAVAPSGSIRLLYGSGDVGAGITSTIFEVVSDDDGATWSLPRAITDGGIQTLRADYQGGWHALAIGPEPFNAQLRYGYAPAAGTWQWRAIPGASDEYLGDLALLELRGQTARFALTAQGLGGGRLDLYRSDDGLTWVRVPMPQLAGAIDNPTLRPQVLAVPRGDGLVVLSWSNYGSGRVAATVSTDGGLTFGPPEVIALHDASAAISDEWSHGILPSVVYDPEADALAASWVEFAKGSPDTFPFPVQTNLAVRPLDAPLGEPWRFAVTPVTRDEPRTVLDPQRRAYLVATPDGAAAGLLIIDERNYQHRLTYRDIRLSALTTQAES